jgi:hypothetical protein
MARDERNVCSAVTGVLLVAVIATVVGCADAAAEGELPVPGSLLAAGVPLGTGVTLLAGAPLAVGVVAAPAPLPV